MHPRAVIVAAGGPVELEDHCVLEETCVVENASRDGGTLRVGRCTRVCVGAHVTATSIGPCNVFDVKCVVSGPGLPAATGCCFGTGVTVVVEDEALCTDRAYFLLPSTDDGEGVCVHNRSHPGLAARQEAAALLVSNSTRKQLSDTPGGAP